MKKIDIVEAIVNMIEKKVFDEWKHEGYIGFNSDEIYATIDGKEYKIIIQKISE